MYSTSWFETFAANVPPEVTNAETNAIERYAPPNEYSALLDIGCGIGRNATALVKAGYDVTGIDVSEAAITEARRNIPDAKFFVLDQLHIDQLPQQFDVAIILWNSIGFRSRDEDTVILHKIAGVLRTGGKLLIDMYNPAWLAANEQKAARDERGATIDRWLHHGRSRHRIAYADGKTDHIEFNVYAADELTAILRAAGFTVATPLVWWNESTILTAQSARYQLVATKAGDERE